MSVCTARPNNQLHRANLHDLLAATARSFKRDVIHLSERITGFTETATSVAAHLASGRTVHGDVLIGADGVRSAVRAQIAGADHARVMQATAPGA